MDFLVAKSRCCERKIKKGDAMGNLHCALLTLLNQRSRSKDVRSKDRILVRARTLPTNSRGVAGGACKELECNRQDNTTSPLCQGMLGL